MKFNAKMYDRVRGHFLLARLNVKGIFARSVVWVFEFSEKKGARGLILNKPLGKKLASCAPTFAGTPLSEIPVYEGGPVEFDRLCFLLRSRMGADGNIAVRVGATAEEIRDVIYNPGVRVYGFAGRAEWEPGQLEDELLRNTWLRVRMDVEEWEKGRPEDLWRRLAAKTKKPEAELMLRAPENLNDN